MRPGKEIRPGTAWSQKWHWVVYSHWACHYSKGSFQDVYFWNQR
jgi:hypothetical protein